MRHFARLFLIFAAFLFAPAAMARTQISIDLSTQRMEVQTADGQNYSWPISSARAGYVTPRGVFAPTSLQAMHYSKKYHHSPMPHSIFFHRGYAIHGTYATRWLGRPVSHGCVRISPANAATLYSCSRRRRHDQNHRLAAAQPFLRASMARSRPPSPLRIRPASPP